MPTSTLRTIIATPTPRTDAVHSFHELPTAPADVNAAGDEAIALASKIVTQYYTDSAYSVNGVAKLIRAHTAKAVSAALEPLEKSLAEERKLCAFMIEGHDKQVTRAEFAEALRHRPQNRP